MGINEKEGEEWCIEYARRKEEDGSLAPPSEIYILLYTQR